MNAHGAKAAARAVTAGAAALGLALLTLTTAPAAQAVPTVEITGTVMGALTPSPVPGAFVSGLVYLSPDDTYEDYDQTTTFTTDADGAFSVTVSGGSGTQSYWVRFPGVTDYTVGGNVETSDHFEVVPGSPVSVQVYEQLTTVALSPALAGADVSVYRWDPTYLYFDSVTELATRADGTAAFFALPGDRYTLRYDSDPSSDYATQYLGGTTEEPSRASSTGTFVVSDDTAATVPFGLSLRSATITGSVTWAHGAPANADVALMRWTGDYWSDAGDAAVSPGGTFTLHAGAGTYSLAVSSYDATHAPSYQETWLGGFAGDWPYTLDEVEHFDVGPDGGAVTRDLHVSEQLTTLTVTLTDFDASSQTYVDIVDLSTGTSDERWITTDASGAYTLTMKGTASGTYFIRAMPTTIEGPTATGAEQHDVVVSAPTPTTVALTGTELDTSLVLGTLDVSIGGVPRIGATLTATTSLHGVAADVVSATTFTTSWSDGIHLLGTGPTVTVPDDVGGTGDDLVATVVASTPGALSAFEGEDASNDLPIFAPGSSPFPVTGPTVTGTPRVGATLTAQTGTWVPKPTSFRYQWLRDGRAVSGATHATYTVATADRGARLAVRLTPVLAGHDATSITSGSVGPVAAAATTPATGRVKPRITVTVRHAKKVTPKKRAKVRVALRAHGVPRSAITGKITVKIGKKKVHVRLTAKKHGKVTVRLPRLNRGKHKVVVRFHPTHHAKKVLTRAKKKTRATVHKARR